MMKIFFLSLLLFFLCVEQAAQSDPWGKDADMTVLASPASPPIYEKGRKLTCELDPLTAAGVAMIRFHQVVISPADGPRSNFIPSSSQYTLEGMEKYGFFYGFLLGCDRLMRENDSRWHYKKMYGEYGLTKYDPVR